MDNPVTPTYSRAKPVNNPACYNCESLDPVNYQLLQQSKQINILPGTENVSVQTERQITEDNFTLSVTPYLDPTVALSITNPSAILLRGTTQNDVALSWVLNKAIPLDQQTLLKDQVSVDISGATTNDGGLTWTLSLSGQGLVNTTSYKITVDDGTKQASSTAQVKFGNYLYWSEGNELDSGDANALFQALSRTQIGPLTSRKYGSPYIKPQSKVNTVFFYIAIAAEDDDTAVDDMDKFYEHDGQDPGGGMFLVKQNVPINNGLATINYNFYRGLHGAQGGAMFEVI